MSRLLLIVCAFTAFAASVPNATAQDLPPGWYLAYGLDILSPDVDLQDPDCDGLSNFAEFQAGSDPLDCNSPNPCPCIPPENFTIEFVTGPTLKLLLSWEPEQGRSYIIEVATISDGGNPTWEVLETLSAGEFEYEPDLTANPAALFRVRLDI